MTCAEAKSVIGNLPIRFVGGGGGNGSALFFDQRDDANCAPMGTAQKWWTRMFNTIDYNDISADIELLSWAITEADVGANHFKVAGDQTAYFPTGHRFDVRGSTGNDSGDTPYIVTGQSYAAGFTTINVASVVDATVDGIIHNGMFRFLTSKKYKISGHVNAYFTYGTDVRLVNISGVTYTSGYASNTPGTMTAPLSSLFANLTAIPVHFKTQIEPASDSVWEVQQWCERAYAVSAAQGVREQAAGHGGVVNFAILEIEGV